MRKGTITTLCTSLAHAKGDDDRMCNFWGSLFHNGEYLAKKNLALKDFFDTERVRKDSEFRRQYECVSNGRYRGAAVPCINIGKEHQVCFYGSWLYWI